MSENRTPEPFGPPNETAGALSRVGRRTVLRGIAGAAAVGGAASLLSACGSSGGSSSSSDTGSKSAAAGKATGTVTFGSNATAEPEKAYEKVFAAAKKAVGITVKPNVVDHNTFQNNISTYLQSNPQDVFTWFAGERMQFFAGQGLCSQLDDVWAKIGGNYTAAMKAQSKGTDGHYYFVPFDYYPWAVFYRKSLFQKNGYTEPKTWDEFTALAKKMKKDGLIPIAFTDKDVWPAMGTFDYLNLRMNGFDFHMNLMRKGQGWTDPRVKKVFDQWRELIPFYSPGAMGLTWQEGATQIVNKKAGMMVLGLDQIGTVFTGGNAPADDLGFFAFPEINPTYGQDTVEAPIDGFMMPKKPKNAAGGKALLEYLGKASTQQMWLGSNPADIATANGADTSKYTKPQAAAVQLIGKAKHLSQFCDRDTRADFGDPIVGPAIQRWYQNPSDVSSVLKKLDQQAKTIWATAG